MFPHLSILPKFSNPLAMLRPSAKPCKTEVQHREMPVVGPSISPTPKLILECNNEIRLLSASPWLRNTEDDSSIFVVVPILFNVFDNAFFDGRLKKVARATAWTTDPHLASANVGGYTKNKTSERLVICIPLCDEDTRSKKDLLTILLREMAYIDYGTNICRCEKCSIQSEQRIIGLTRYFSQLNGAVNSKLVALGDQWEILTVKDLDTFRETVVKMAVSSNVTKMPGKVTEKAEVSKRRASM